jgi:hypothetical protein
VPPFTPRLNADRERKEPTKEPTKKKKTDNDEPELPPARQKPERLDTPKLEKDRNEGYNRGTTILNGRSNVRLIPQ